MFKVKGKDRTKVHERLTDIVYSMEKQGRFDYQIDVQGTEDGGWQGSLKIDFHTKAYPSDYQKKESLPRLPGGERNEAVDKIYLTNGIRKR